MQAVAQTHRVRCLHAHDAASMARALAQLAAQGTALVVINGGDGTAQAALSVLAGAHSPFAHPPDLAFLAGGRSNISPAAAGGTGDPARVLARLLDAWPGRVQRHALALLRVQDDAGTVRHGLLVLAGGVVTAVQACRDFRARSRIPGLRGGLGTAAWVVGTLARGIGGGTVLPAAPVALALDGAAAQVQSVHALVATTLPRLGPGLRPWWGGDGGALRCTVVRAPARRLGIALARLARGRPGGALTPDNGYWSGTPRAVRVEIHGAYQLDGEDYRAAWLALSADQTVTVVHA